MYFKMYTYLPTILPPPTFVCCPVNRHGTYFLSHGFVYSVYCFSGVQVEIRLEKEPEEDHFIMVPYLSSLDFFLAPSRVMQGRISVCSTISTGTSTIRDSFDLKVCVADT